MLRCAIKVLIKHVAYYFGAQMTLKYRLRLLCVGLMLDELAVYKNELEVLVDERTLSLEKNQ